jgi:hypothetical protein
MKYLELNRNGRISILDELESMPAFLEQTFGSLSEPERLARGPSEAFAPVEQCWHLADLEREGFGMRLRRLRDESEPFLPDFDGGRIAVERDYLRRSLGDGMSAFRVARSENLDLLRSLQLDQWSRAGTQLGVGRVMLCDLPHMMAEHDTAHRDEIHAWARSTGRLS